jgi:hypothetical protein
MVPGPENPERLHHGDEVMQDPTSQKQADFFFIFHVLSFFLLSRSGV